MNPKMSIVVPIYNVEPYLEHCLESIVSQTLREIEIILVDDGSPDHCPEICDRWVEQDSRIKVIHQKNQGLQGATYTGTLAAGCEIVGFVDSDDWVAPEHFERLYTAMQELDADIVRSGLMMQQADGTFTERQPEAVKVWQAAEFEAQVLEPYWSRTGNLYLDWSNARWDKLWKRSILLPALESFRRDYSMGEDLVLNLKALPQCKRVAQVPGCGYYLRHNGASLTHGFSMRRYTETCRFMEDMAKIAAEQNRGELEGKTLSNGIWFSCAVSYLNAVPKPEEKSRRAECFAGCAVHVRQLPPCGTTVRLAFLLAQRGRKKAALWQFDLNRKRKG